MSESIALWLNVLSACLNMSGALLMFFNTPKVDSQLYIYNKAEMAEIHKRDERMNKLTRFGMLLLFVGFLLQLGALVIPKI
jgi:hypothetical protein